MSITLTPDGSSAITLPDDLIWIDEFDHNAVAQHRERNLGGGLDIEETALVSGVPVTLTGGQDYAWALRPLIVQLKAVEATPGLQSTLALHDGSTHTVVFRRDGTTPAIEARQIIEFSDPDDSTYYSLILRLIKVD